jgi:hypothetical protein
MELEGQSGPVAVLIEYRIREQDTAAFLDAIAEQRRCGRRDGARNWELMRDTQHPEQWIESYHVPTWNDYVRHNQREPRRMRAYGTASCAASGPERPRCTACCGARPAEDPASRRTEREVNLH